MRRGPRPQWRKYESDKKKIRVTGGAVRAYIYSVETIYRFTQNFWDYVGQNIMMGPNNNLNGPAVVNSMIRNPVIGLVSVSPG